MTERKHASELELQSASNASRPRSIKQPPFLARTSKRQRPGRPLFRPRGFEILTRTRVFRIQLHGFLQLFDRCIKFPRRKEDPAEIRSRSKVRGIQLHRLLQGLGSLGSISLAHVNMAEEEMR